VSFVVAFRDRDRSVTVSQQILPKEQEFGDLSQRILRFSVSLWLCGGFALCLAGRVAFHHGLVDSAAMQSV
jgi:hypothetical protein